MKKIITISAASLGIVGVIGIAGLNASAVTVNQKPGYGIDRGAGRQSSLEMRATVLGMSIDELEKALETKTMSQIAVEKGFTEATFQSSMTSAAKARWEARGLSADEITQRMKQRDARHAANNADHAFGSGDGVRMGGYGRNR